MKTNHLSDCGDQQDWDLYKQIFAEYLIPMMHSENGNSPGPPKGRSGVWNLFGLQSV